jgi:hypothetical protein
VSTPQAEFRALIRSKILAGMTADEAADAVATLAYRIEDEWQEIDVSTYADGPKRQLLDQRWLVVRIPREGRHRAIDRTADRTVEGT